MTTLTLVKAQERKCLLDVKGSIHRHHVDNYEGQNKNFENKLNQHLKKKKTAKNLSNEIVYTIPVVVHVVHNDPTQTPGKSRSNNISDEQIFSQIEALNVNFRKKNADTINIHPLFKGLASDCKIEFCLASRDPDGNSTNGITRHFINQESWNVFNNTEYQRLKTYGYWPSTQYLNIWVANLSEDVLGIATFPGESNLPGLPKGVPEEEDGVVVHHQVFGNQTGTANGNPFDQGRTTVHEIGHWLGLLHTFQGGCSGNGDYCSDTPIQEDGTSGCPLNQFSCTVKDMTENFMDYSNDACMHMFTIDQKNRMRAVIEVDPRRNKLLSSPGCCGVESSNNLPFSSGFEEDDLTLIPWGTSSTSSSLEWELNSIGKSSFQSLKANCENSLNDTLLLTSEIIDFSNANNPSITFDLAYNIQESITSNDRIILSYETACNEKWNTLKEFSIEEIITSRNNNSGYLPTEDEWITHYLELTNLASLFAVKIRFQIISGKNGIFHLDNINLFNESNEPSFSIYPNPANNQLNIDFNHKFKRSGQVKIYNLLGNIVNTYDIPESFSKTFKISTSNLINGLYIVVLSSENYTQTEKLVISK